MRVYVTPRSVRAREESEKKRVLVLEKKRVLVLETVWRVGRVWRVLFLLCAGLEEGLGQVGVCVISRACVCVSKCVSSCSGVCVCVCVPHIHAGALH
jgi:hypothetical protein